MSDVDLETEGGGRKHSRFAPSSLTRILACPRSVALGEAAAAAGSTVRRSSIWAAEGSVAHTVAEGRLVNHPAVGLLSIGHVVEMDGFKITVDADMHDCGAKYAVYVRGLMSATSKLYVEQTVHLDAIVGAAANMYGHLDAAVFTPETGVLDVIDYKYGRGIRVSALDNAQLKAYGLGALTSLPDIDPDDVKTVRIHVFQPRVPGNSAPDTIPTVDLLRWGHEELAVVTSLILKDGAVQNPYVTGEHCRFCPALAQCPAIRDRANKAARNVFEASPLPASALSDDEVSVCLDEVDVIEPWFEAVRAEGLSRAEKGSSIKGRKVVMKRGTREWNDEKVAELELTRFGLTPHEIVTTKLKSVAQIDKLLSAGVFDQTNFKNLWTSKSSGHALAKASDPRPSVRTATAAEVFSRAPLQESN